MTASPGDHRERFERIFHAEYAAVLRYAAMRADLDIAKDAAAQTFLVAWRRRSEIPDPPRAWLLGVTRRTLADLRRSRRRQEDVRSRLAAGEAAGAHAYDSPTTEGDRELVGSALDQLGDADAEALRLVYWDDLSCREAAEILGCSVTAFKVRLLRARRRAGRALEHLDRAGLAAHAERHETPRSTDVNVRAAKEAR